MKDETYVFISDVKEKKITARSARHTRKHCGKGGRVRLPSDNLSKKELLKMSGECKSYRLNDPIKWAEFRAMPDDIKITYIKLLRQKFNVPDAHIYKMMGTNGCSFSKEMNRLGFAVGKRNAATPWDKEGFYAWVHGADKLPEPVPEEPIPEEPAEDPILEEVTIIEEPEIYVEDDLPFEEPDPILDVHHVALCAQIDALKIRIDELLKSKEELMAVHEKVVAENAWLRNEYENQRMQVRILEAQMDVVRLVFGGKNNG